MENANQRLERKIHFFDLSREIRDLIYEWVITAMYNPNEHGNIKLYNQLVIDPENSIRSALGWQRHTCDCDLPVLIIRRLKPPYFAYGCKYSCFLPDLWLYSCSLVSKQFSVEFRSCFWRSNILHIGNIDRNGPDASLETDAMPFLYGLKTESKDIRRLMITMKTFVGKGHFQVCTQDTLCRYCSDYDIVSRLECFQGFLHPGATVLLAMTYVADKTIVRRSFYHCTGFEQNATKLNVKLIEEGELESWVKFLDHVKIPRTSNSMVRYKYLEPGLYHNGEKHLQSSKTSS